MTVGTPGGSVDPDLESGTSSMPRWDLLLLVALGGCVGGAAR